MASVYKRKGKGNWIIGYFDHTGRRRAKSARTTDKRVAERIAAELEAQIALRRDGVVDALQDALQRADAIPIKQHVDEYVESCKRAGRARGTMASKRKHLERLLDQTGIERLSHLTADVMERHLRALADGSALPKKTKKKDGQNDGAPVGLSNRSLNYALSEAKTFLNWCEKRGRIAANPLRVLTKLREDPVRRRPLEPEELDRLLAVAARNDRQVYYLLAAHAGLRRSEIHGLRWRDVDFDRGVIVVRDGKAKGRVDEIPIHPQLAAELQRVQPTEALPSAAIIAPLSSKRRLEDFKEAEIPTLDEAGRKADLHSLRVGLGTTLARLGVQPQVAQRIMRHSDYRLTLRHYTRLELRDDAAAMAQVPAIGDEHEGAGAEQKATGTDGPDGAPERQQIRQQSQHDIVPDGAKQCDDGGDQELVAVGAGTPRRDDEPPVLTRQPRSVSSSARDGGIAKWLRRRIANP